MTLANKQPTETNANVGYYMVLIYIGYVIKNSSFVLKY